MRGGASPQMAYLLRQPAAFNDVRPRAGQAQARHMGLYGATAPGKTPRIEAAILDVQLAPQRRLNAGHRRGGGESGRPRPDRKCRSVMTQSWSATGSAALSAAGSAGSAASAGRGALVGSRPGP